MSVISKTSYVATRKIKVLLVDDQKEIYDSVMSSLDNPEYEVFGNIRFDYANSIDQARIMSETRHYDVYVADYDISSRGTVSLPDRVLIDGIGLVRYFHDELIHSYQRLSLMPQAFNGIIYSNSTREEISETHSQDVSWCDTHKVKILRKDYEHEELFRTIEKFFVDPRLPDRVKFAYMTSNEILLHLASGLLAEMKDEPNSNFYFGGGTSPIKNQEVHDEILKLTPLGKEVVGNSIESIKKLHGSLIKERGILKKSIEQLKDELKSKGNE